MGLDKDEQPTEDPLVHAAWAQQLPLPEPVIPTPLTPQQVAMVRHHATEPQKLKATVMEKLKQWTIRKQQFEVVNKVYREQLPTGKRSTLGKLDLFLLDDILSKAGHPDSNYVQDLASGFNVTSSIDAGSLGEWIEGGQRVNRKTGQGGNLEELKEQCQFINSETLRRAQAHVPRTQEDQKLATEAWAKFQKDVERGYANTPTELDSLDNDA